LRLILEQAADRVSHRIQVLNSFAQVLAELHSLEGTSADEWPPSPALQSCSVQEIRPGQSAAFLVGMSGKSHWSASVEATPESGDLVFDCACRVQSNPLRLGSSYSLACDSLHADSLQIANDAVVVHFAGGELRIIPAATGNGLHPSVLSSSENALKIGPVVGIASARLIKTFRWQYRLLVTVPQT
jgi:hypothetical protein